MTMTAVAQQPIEQERLPRRERRRAAHRAGADASDDEGSLATQAQRTGYSVEAFCVAIGICRASYYNLPPKLQPKSVMLGRRRIIREQPAEYLARIAETQEAARTEGGESRRVAN